MKKIIFILFLFIGINSKAQINLVRDSSFELTDTSCHPPSSVPWNIDCLYFWYNPTDFTPDYLSANNIIGGGFYATPKNSPGYQIPHSGIAYAGLDMFSTTQTPGNIENVATKLLQTLKKGKLYKINFYLSLADSSRWAIDNIGVLFTKDSIVWSTSDWNIDSIPQVVSPTGDFISDTVGWTKITMYYVANGYERYLTMGNFKISTNTNYIQISNTHTTDAYYYLDDVSVYQLPDTITPPPPVDTACSLKCNNLLLYGVNKLMFKQLLANTQINIYNSIGVLVYSSSNYQNDWIPPEAGLYIYEAACSSGVQRRDKFVVQ